MKKMVGRSPKPQPKMTLRQMEEEFESGGASNPGFTPDTPTVKVKGGGRKGSVASSIVAASSGGVAAIEGRAPSPLK